MALWDINGILRNKLSLHNVVYQLSLKLSNVLLLSVIFFIAISNEPGLHNSESHNYLKASDVDLLLYDYTWERNLLVMSYNNEFPDDIHENNGGEALRAYRCGLACTYGDASLLLKRYKNINQV